MNNPLVSCLCPTFNRPKLLQESVQCFLNQDYQNKEMIILNDQPNVTLKLYKNYDNIRLYNHTERFKSLGEKRNHLKSLADGDYFCIWDDDDLYLPFRISESVYFAQKNPNQDIIKAQDGFLSRHNKDYKVATNRFHSQAIVTREYMKKKDYVAISIGEDALFEKTAKVLYVDIFPSFWIIVRYGMETYHISEIPEVLYPKSWEIAGKVAERGALSGEIVIEPKFHHDYWEDMRKVLNKINGFWGEELMKKIATIAQIGRATAS